VYHDGDRHWLSLAGARLDGNAARLARFNNTLKSGRPGPGAAIKIKAFLSPTDVTIDVDAHGKASLLKNLSSRAAAALGLSVDAVATQIERRDELGSTGIGGGSAYLMRAFAR
jgi:hypothetical protein